MLPPDWDSATIPSYALYVGLNLVHSWAGQFPSRAEPCGDMQFLRGHFHKIAIMQNVLRSDLWIGCAVTCSHWIRDEPCLIGKWSTQSHPPWSWLWELQPWVPRLSYAHALIRQDSHLSHLVNKWEECFLELKDTLEEKNSWGFLVGQELQGDCGHFLWLTPHWGSLEDCLACAGYRKLRRVTLGPRSILIVYCLNTVYTMYSCCQCLCTWL